MIDLLKRWTTKNFSGEHSTASSHAKKRPRNSALALTPPIIFVFSEGAGAGSSSLLRHIATEFNIEYQEVNFGHVHSLSALGGDCSAVMASGLTKRIDTILECTRSHNVRQKSQGKSSVLLFEDFDVLVRCRAVSGEQVSSHAGPLRCCYCVNCEAAVDIEPKPSALTIALIKQINKKVFGPNIATAGNYCKIPVVFTARLQSMAAFRAAGIHLESPSSNPARNGGVNSFLLPSPSSVQIELARNIWLRRHPSSERFLASAINGFGYWQATRIEQVEKLMYGH